MVGVLRPGQLPRDWSTLEVTVEEETMNGIVVGIDGSESSARALDWAIEEAVTRGQPLTVVYAWHINEWAATQTTLSHLPDLRAELLEATRTAADEMLRKALVRVERHCDTTIETPEAPAAKALLEASAGADLLVVGRRGAGALHHVLTLGSVSSKCVHHAMCPVTVVPSLE